MRLFLVRHGQTEANLSGVFCGMTDIDLTPTGVAQAQSVADWLADVNFGSAVSSTLLRARHTADIVLQKHPIAAAADEAFNEMSFGDWEMRHHLDLQREDADAWAAWIADWQTARPTGGESFAEFSHRVEQVTQALRNQHREHNQLIVAHQGVLSLLLATLLTMPASEMWHFHFAHGAYSVLDVQDGFATLRALNNRAPWQP